MMLRFNPSTKYGALEGSYSYPMWWRDDLFWYVKIFDGYAQNLIDYNIHVSNISLGISFSR
jgi:outer membrane phospholipase A